MPLVLLALLQEVPSRWDFKPGSWVEWNCVSLLRKDAVGRPYREEAGGTRPLPFTEGLREVSRREELWKERPCTRIEYRDENRTVQAWVVEGVDIPARDMAASPRWVGVPSNVVRALRVEKQGTSILTSTLEVLDLHARIDIAGRTFDCVLESSSSTSEVASGTILRSRRRWLTAEVPGHVVRQDRQCTANPEAVPHNYTTRDELKTFHVER